jgi:tetratricopeptide (TPR) repeat protein
MNVVKTRENETLATMRLLKAHEEKSFSRRWALWKRAMDLEARRESYSARLAANVHFCCGRDLQDTGDLARAEAQFRAAIAKDRRCSDAHIELGFILEKRGDLIEALAEFQVAVRIDPNDVSARSILGSIIRERGERGDDAGAEIQFRLCIAQDPRCSDFHNDLGSIAEKRCDVAEAEAHYQAAITADSRCFEAHYNLGRLFESKGDLP